MQNKYKIITLSGIALMAIALVGCGNRQNSSKPTPRTQLNVLSNKKTNNKGTANISLHTDKNAKLDIHSSKPNVIRSHSNHNINVQMPTKLGSDKIMIKAKQKKHLSTLKSIHVTNNSNTYKKYVHNIKINKIKRAKRAKLEQAKRAKAAKQREQAKLAKEYPPIQDKLQNMSNNQLFMTQAMVKGKVLSWGAQNDGSGMILIKDKAGNEFTLEPSHRLKGIENGSTVIAYGGNFDKQKINSSQTNNAISSEYLGDKVINMPSIDHIKLLGHKGDI